MLEAVVNEGSPEAAFSVVVCHPHPLGGGSLHNKVAYHAMKVMNAPEWGFGWPVLRFNFRGVGRSEGVHDGAAETEDVRAAVHWIENEYKRPVVVAGFSFGAAMALGACCEGNPSQVSESRAPSASSGQAFDKLKAGAPPREQRPVHGDPGSGAPAIDVRALVAIGLPIHSGNARPDRRQYDYSFLAHCALPKLFLSGDNDQFATKAELIEVAAAAADPRQLALVPGADHFFTGRLEPMQSYLSGWLKEYVYDPGQRSAV